MEGMVDISSSVAKYVMTVDMFPIFFLADFSLSALLIRNDSSLIDPKFRQKHPFASWLCTIITGLSGAFVASFLFGDPILDILQDNLLVVYLTLIWYLINYSPFDVFFNVMMHPVYLLPACILQEFLRVRFIYLGLQTAASAYPKAPLIIMTGGIIKGNGYGYIKIVEQLVRGLWNPKTNEILEMTYYAKSGAIGSFLFLLHFYKVLNIRIEFLYLIVVMGFVICRFVLMHGGSDPMLLIEVPLCRLLFGSWEERKPSKPLSKENLNGAPKKSQPKGNIHKGGGDSKANSNEKKAEEVDINQNVTKKKRKAKKKKE